MDGYFTDVDEEAYRFRTPTSGGKANAIDILPKDDGGLWILLTDDDDAATIGAGAVRVLEWDGCSIKLVSELSCEMEGASHAVWLD